LQPISHKITPPQGKRKIHIILLYPKIVTSASYFHERFVNFNEITKQIALFSTLFAFGLMDSNAGNFTRH
jgi:hypothetical protein